MGEKERDKENSPSRLLLQFHSKVAAVQNGQGKARELGRLRRLWVDGDERLYFWGKERKALNRSDLGMELEERE